METERDGRDADGEREGRSAPPGSGAGEDDGGVAVDGKDDHLKNDQKPTDH